MNREPPIQNLDSSDIVGERVDGGIDLAITVSGPIDSTPECLGMLEQKLQNYLREIQSDNFRRKYRRTPNGRIRIIVRCPYAIAPEAVSVLQRIGQSADELGVALITDNTAR